MSTAIPASQTATTMNEKVSLGFAAEARDLAVEALLTTWTSKMPQNKEPYTAYTLYFGILGYNFRHFWSSR